MRSLEHADATCESYFPELLSGLTTLSMADLERPGSPAIELFRRSGGPALLIPKQYNGLGASPSDVIAVVRAIAARAPSLAVATAMHHFSVATIFTLADSLRASGLEWALLEGIADQNLLVSSGFAEGTPGQGILTPVMSGRRVPGGVVLTGAKRPCSLARSMDLLSASAAVIDEAGNEETVLLLVPASMDGISVHPFWASTVLAGAESDEVRLSDVFVDDNLIMPSGTGASGELDELQTVGFMWFEMIITSCYLGMASALVDRAVTKPALNRERIAEMGTRLETAALLLQSIATLLSNGHTDNEALAQVVIARYGAEDAIVDVTNHAVAALGGMSFISDPDIAYLAAACQCVRFHPPSRITGNQALADHFRGDVFRIR